MLEETKSCNDPKCEQTNPQRLSNFHKEKNLKGGYRHQCKTCRNKRFRWWKDLNREHFNAYMREYNKGKTGRKCQFSRRLKARYGITVADYDKMFAEQNGECKICHRKPKGMRKLVIDHCHDSGKTRGLLCHSCNRSLAILDNKKLLDAATKYLEIAKP